MYPEAVVSGVTNDYYSPGVCVTGGANIYNCYISQTKNALQIDGGDVYAENTTFDGGAVANIDVGGSGEVTLKNCVTSKSSDPSGLLGIGIHPKNAAAKITLEGTFKQYNWLRYDDLPSNYQSYLYDIYKTAAYADYTYEYGGETYVNMGLLCTTDTGSFTQAQAQTVITDHTGNDYGFIEQEAASVYATVYTAKGTEGSPEMVGTASYSPRTNGQHASAPVCSFDFTSKNYQAKTAGNAQYCYYDSATKLVNIGLSAGGSKSWNTSILTPKKNGKTLPYTVSMGGTDYTGKSITFSAVGDYEVTYSYTDPYNYDVDGNAYSADYTKTVTVHVAIPQYAAAFTYAGAAGTYDAKLVIGSDNNTYVMPDVSATSDTIGSTTVGGQTVYFPIVTVNPTKLNGNDAYKNGKGFYFAPVFSELNITDYDQSSGAVAYTYSASSAAWPHGRAAIDGPDKAVFGYTGTGPYGRSMNAQYYKFKANNLGPCYTTNDIEQNNDASERLVKYYYISNDGTTYYYYVKYSFTKLTYKASGSCVAEGSLVTMADGSKKLVEDVKPGDEVLSWSFYKGAYEVQTVMANMDEGTEAWVVLTLHFSDGTEVRTMYSHGFFDATRGTMVYLDTENVKNYLGDAFIKQSATGDNETVTLTDYSIKTEIIGAYTVLTAHNYNCLVNDMLSCCPEPECPGLFEYFELDGNMRYDEAKMQQDIETYGVYEYADLAECMTEEMFDALDARYFKISAEKYGWSAENIIEIFNMYMADYK